MNTGVFAPPALKAFIRKTINFARSGWGGDFAAEICASGAGIRVVQPVITPAQPVSVRSAIIALIVFIVRFLSLMKARSVDWAENRFGFGGRAGRGL